MQNIEPSGLTLAQSEVVHVAVGVMANKQGQILIALRHASAHQGGLWEFPGGKIEAGETVPQALTRELKEELNITVHNVTPLIKVKHQYSDLVVLLDVWTIDKYSGEASGVEGQKINWLYPEQLSEFSFPAANYPIICAARLADEYAILNASDPLVLAEQMHALLAKGVKLIQLRVKTLSEQVVVDFCQWAAPLCKKHAALLMLNSAVKGLEKVSVDGLHLTAADLLRHKVRPDGFSWVAASCHNLSELQHAELIGVDFAVLAPVLSTQTHPDTQPLGWEEFQKLVEMTNLPVFALGGLKKRDKALAKKLGGQGIAGISCFLN